MHTPQRLCWIQWPIQSLIKPIKLTQTQLLFPPMSTALIIDRFKSRAMVTTNTSTSGSMSFVTEERNNSSHDDAAVVKPSIKRSLFPCWQQSCTSHMLFIRSEHTVCVGLSPLLARNGILISSYSRGDTQMTSTRAFSNLSRPPIGPVMFICVAPHHD